MSAPYFSLLGVSPAYGRTFTEAEDTVPNRDYVAVLSDGTWRRRFGAYDHAVFVTYSLCFMSLLFGAIAALGQVPGISGGLLFLAMLAIFDQLGNDHELTQDFRRRLQIVT